MFAYWMTGSWPDAEDVVQDSLAKAYLRWQQIEQPDQVGFQPEPPPPRTVTGIRYTDSGHWRMVTTVTEPFGEGTQTITQARNGRQLATISGGKVSVEPAPSSGSGLPLPGDELPLRQLLAAGLGGRCAPSAALGGQGPVTDGRPRCGSRSPTHRRFPRSCHLGFAWARSDRVGL